MDEIETKVFRAVKNTLNADGETDVKRVADHLGWNPRRKAQRGLDALAKRGLVHPQGEKYRLTSRASEIAA